MPVTIKIPGSKSISNRLLILSALSGQKTTITGIAPCEDTDYMIAALRKLGFKINRQKNTITLQKTQKPLPKTIKLYTGNAGTTTRFLSAFCTLLNRRITIDGDKRMRQRPIHELVKALQQIGAQINLTGNCPPLTIHPQIPHNNQVKIPGNISSQYLSALLMIAPKLHHGLTINIVQKLYSKPYLELTINLLKSCKIRVENKNFKQLKVRPQKFKTPTIQTVEGDASSASYVGAYAALHPRKTIYLSNIHRKSIQGDIIFLKHLEKMGCQIKQTPEGLLIKGPQKLKSLGRLDMNETPDLVMTFAVLAMFTKGKTRLTNISNLRIKESDRLNALQNEIKKFGIKVLTGPDFIEITGNPSRLQKIATKKITIKTYHDHRIAMSFAILLDHFPHLKIENPRCVDKSYRSFWEDLDNIRTADSNIVLTGLRGSGKTKIGQELSKQTTFNYIDIDQEIEKSARMNIPQIVAKKGWTHFRKLEKEMTKKIAAQRNQIIATGGGTVIDPENLKALQKTGKIVYLKRTPRECFKWIKEKTDRPALTKETDPLKELENIYQKRKKIYEKSADIILHRSDDLTKDSRKIIRELLSAK